MTKIELDVKNPVEPLNCLISIKNVSNGYLVSGHYGTTGSDVYLRDTYVSSIEEIADIVNDMIIDIPAGLEKVKAAKEEERLKAEEAKKREKSANEQPKKK